MQGQNVPTVSECVFRLMSSKERNRNFRSFTKTFAQSFQTEHVWRSRYRPLNYGYSLHSPKATGTRSEAEGPLLQLCEQYDE